MENYYISVFVAYFNIVIDIDFNVNICLPF